MKKQVSRVVVCLLLNVALSISAMAQSSFQSAVDPAPTDQSSTVGSTPAAGLWHLVRYSGALDSSNGPAYPSVVGFTFSLYSEPAGGAALWMESQNISVDSQGHYTALLGAASPDGIPEELFASGQARWLGVVVSGQWGEVRVPLVSVPYALQAGDSQSLGGKSAAEYVLSDQIKGQIQQQVRSELQLVGFDVQTAESGSNQSSKLPSASAAGGNGNGSGNPVTLADLKTRLDQIASDMAAGKLEILNKLNEPDPLFSFSLCSELAGNFEVAGKADMELNGSVVGMVGLDAYGNGGKLMLHAKPKGGVDTSLKFSSDFLKLGGCLDLKEAIRRIRAGGSSAQLRLAGVSSGNGAAVGTNLLDQIASIDENAMLQKMLGTASVMQIDPTKMQNLLDSVGNLSFDGNPLSILQASADRQALLDALPMPPQIRTTLGNPGALVGKLKTLLDAGLCNMGNQAPALNQLLEPVCALVSDHYAKLLDRVDDATGKIQTNVNTIKGGVQDVQNKVQDVLDLMPGGSNCKLFCG